MIGQCHSLAHFRPHLRKKLMTPSDGAALAATPADLRHESEYVREALSALGRLLGAALIEPPRNLGSFVADHLAAPAQAVVAVASILRGVDAPLVQVAVARLLDAASDLVLTDDLGDGVPGYGLVTTAIDEQTAAPDDLAAYLPAGQAFTFDTVLVLNWSHGAPRIALHVRREDASQARTALSNLLARSRSRDNFYRGQTLQVVADDRDLEFTPVAPSSTTRADVIHAPQVWTEIDATLGGLARNGEVLASAGLGVSRGVLIVGPPGVGKTALTRVIANELPAGTTTLLIDAGATARGLGRVYESLSSLSPAAVFLDDIDLLAGDRRTGTAGPALREFLTHLDGFSPTDAVITVATSNAMDTIDPALLRPGRFDSVIEVGPPAIAARVQILQRYLRALGDFELSEVAALTEGASGADLREIVRRAVLEHGSAVTVGDLASVVRTGRWRPKVSTGQYL